MRPKCQAKWTGLAGLVRLARFYRVFVTSLFIPYILPKDKRTGHAPHPSRNHLTPDPVPLPGRRPLPVPQAGPFFHRFLIERGATVLFTSESSPEAPDADLQFLADGVIELQREKDQRYLSVLKFRGSGFQPGRHAMRLDNEGMKVFPRLIPEAYQREFTPEPIPSGVPELDELLHLC